MGLRVRRMRLDPRERGRGSWFAAAARLRRPSGPDREE